MYLFVQVVGDESAGGIGGGARLAFDADAEVSGAGTVGKTVVAGGRGRGGVIDADGDVLSGEIVGHGLVVGRFEVERGDDLAFGDFAVDDELAVAVPAARSRLLVVIDLCFAVDADFGEESRKLRRRHR